MTTTSQTQQQAPRNEDLRRDQQREGKQQHRQRRDQDQQKQKVNVANPERAVSVAAGSILALLGVRRHSIPGLLIAGLGGAMVYRGASGHCDMYEALGVDTTRDRDTAVDQRISERGIHIEQSYLINRSPEDLYQYWRNFENLPSIMTHLKSVRTHDNTHSHWVAEAPSIAGGTIEWDAQITSDEPNRSIAWRSLPGSQIDTIGEIRFTPGMGDRGTEVHVFMNYLPPAGRIGHWVATLFGESPWRQMREDLHNFKRIMEVGEILTIVGQPRGTCTGSGKREEQ